ncbi:MFS transporter [Stackebrandtia albiflava]|uniref:MFS transporter n=2 Tax=Stackebrandtia albiflava TaxID=406432 RepID=A0A562VAA4_9ACTN|nr:MFS transporter [Stackebrandtia albiflava]
MLALALLGVEALAGVQSAIVAVTTPLMAAELHGQRLYGVVTAAPQVAMFLTMPLGTYLLGRFPAGRLLGWFTAVTVAGAVTSAVAAHVAVFIGGRFVTGLAAGALATVSMGALVTALPRAWRQLVLAGFSAMWLVTSIVGPVYAAWVSEALGWRWALVLYLPLLLLARWGVARRLPAEPPDARRRWDVHSGLLLAVGVGLLSTMATAPGGVVAAGCAVAGLLVTGLAAVRLLPAGTARLRRGRPSAVALLFLLSTVYFGAQSITAIVGHDVLRFDAGRIGVLLGVGSLGWAVAGLVTGRFPARSRRVFLTRTWLSAALLCAGLSLTAAATAGLVPSGLGWYAAGWAAAGVGMGTAYLDAINQIVEPREDGVTPVGAAGAAVIGEAVATAVAGTVSAGAVAALVTQGAAQTVVAVPLWAAAAVALLLPPVAARIRN